MTCNLLTATFTDCLRQGRNPVRNSSTWTVTPSRPEGIDAIHRGRQGRSARGTYNTVQERATLAVR